MEKNGALFWKVQKIVSKGDYLYAVVKEHPFCTKNGYVLLHRIIVENHLGRLLNKNEIVHHKNENKRDNRIENLKVLSSSEHAKMHGQQRGKIMLSLQCPNCKIVFEKEKRKTHIGKKEGKFTACSARCRGQFSRMIQLYGLTEQVKSAISVNILKEYNSLENTEGTHLQGTP